jgi:hypothetical protein
MPARPDECRITVTATIAGHPDSVLRDLRTARAATTRAVQIELELRRPGSRSLEPHWLPEIARGDTAAAREHLEMLSRQGYLSTETHRRLELLIDEFGRLTG